MSTYQDSNFSRKEIKLLKKLVSKACERELSLELKKLDRRFLAWKNGEIDSFELDETIHSYHDGASRNIYKKYNYGDDAILKVAYALMNDLLDEDDFPDESLYEKITPVMDLLQSIQ